MSYSSTLNSASQEKLGAPLKFAYASSAFGVSVLSNSAATLMLFYLSSVVGIAAWKAGLILLVSKLYDIVSDPLAGWLSDRHKSPAGRRRPFLLWGTLVGGVAMALIFTVPFHGDRPVVWLYVLVVNLIYTTGYSLYNVPHLAMATEMTEGFHERTVLQGWRIVAASIGTAVATIGSGVVLGMLGRRTGFGGRVVNSAHDYLILGALFTVLTVAGMIVGWAGLAGRASPSRSSRPRPGRRRPRPSSPIARP